MPSRLASATIFFISAASNDSPCFRRTGVSMAITETGRTTRAPLAVSITCRTSSAVNVAWPRRERDEREVAQRLRAVALVLIEMTFFLHDHAARSTSQRPHGHVIGQRSGGHEDRAFLAEHPRELGLEFFDDAAERIRVGRHRLLVEQAGEQTRILRRCEAEAVAAQTDGSLVGFRRGAPRRDSAAERGRWKGDAEPGADASDLEKPSSIHSRHRASNPA